MSHKFRRAFAVLVVCAASPALAQAAPDPAFIGHYYLSGVMETGSEMLLKADGRFEWFMAYGALDQFAKGTWERLGGTIVLVADMPDASRPLFMLDPRQPWNAKAEAALRETEEDEKRQAIEQKCPFLYDAFDSTTVDAATPEGQPPRNGPEKAKAALAIALDRRGDVERAMAAAMAQPSAAANVAASRAMNNWWNARAEAFDAHYATGLEMASIDDPQSPPACAIPFYEPADVTSPSVWRRGTAVLVGNPETGSRFSSVKVVFHRADGQEARVVTDPGGWAIAPKSSAPVVAISLAFAADPPMASGRMAITPLSEGVQPVRVDVDQLVRAPFTTLVLKIDGKDLLPERGRYSRE